MLTLLEIIFGLFGVILMLVLLAIIWAVLIVAKFAIINVVYILLAIIGLMIVWKTIFGEDGLMDFIKGLK